MKREQWQLVADSFAFLVVIVSFGLLIALLQQS